MTVVVPLVAAIIGAALAALLARATYQSSPVEIRDELDVLARLRSIDHPDARLVEKHVNKLLLRRYGRSPWRLPIDPIAALPNALVAAVNIGAAIRQGLSHGVPTGHLLSAATSVAIAIVFERWDRGLHRWSMIHDQRGASVDEALGEIAQCGQAIRDIFSTLESRSTHAGLGANIRDATEDCRAMLLEISGEVRTLIGLARERLGLPVAGSVGNVTLLRVALRILPAFPLFPERLPLPPDPAPIRSALRELKRNVVRLATLTDAYVRDAP